MERLTISKLEKQTIYEIYRACRICGAGGGYRVPIIQNIVTLDTSDVELVQKIQECLQLEVRSDDRMPPLICELCVDKINDYYEFLKLSRHTNIRTRTRLGLPLQTVKKSEPSPGDSLGDKEPTSADKTAPKKSKAGPKCSKKGQENVNIEEPPAPTPPESRASSVSSRSSRTARRAPTPPRPVRVLKSATRTTPMMLGNKKTAEKEKEQEKETESNDFIRAVRGLGKELHYLIQDNQKYDDNSLLMPRSMKRKETEPPRPGIVPKRTRATQKEPVKELVKEPSPPRYKPGPKSRQAAREDPKSRTAPKEDPKSRQASKEDPKSRQALKEDPKSRQASKEDPKSRQAPKEDPKIPVPLKILKSKSKLNVVSTPPKVEEPPPRPHCAICDIPFKSQSGLSNHMKVHQVTYTKPSQACNPCGQWFVTAEEATTHHRYHSAATFPYHCRRCFEDYKTLPDYDSHISNGLCMPYDLIPDVKCERCWKTFITSTLMDAHKCQGMEGRPGGNCSKCSRPYMTQKTLKMHQKTCNYKKPTGGLVADPDVLRRLKPMQVRIARCDDLLARTSRVDASAVKPNHGLDKSYHYPYIRFKPVKPKPLRSKLAARGPIRDKPERDRYTHWDSDDSDSDSVIKKVDSLSTLCLKKIFSKNMLGKVPRKKRKVENDAFDSINDFSIDSDINNIISSLNDDLSNDCVRRTRKDSLIAIAINDIIGVPNFVPNFKLGNENVARSSNDVHINDKDANNSNFNAGNESLHENDNLKDLNDVEIENQSVVSASDISTELHLIETESQDNTPDEAVCERMGNNMETNDSETRNDLVDKNKYENLEINNDEILNFTSIDGKNNDDHLKNCNETNVQNNHLSTEANYKFSELNHSENNIDDLDNHDKSDNMQQTSDSGYAITNNDSEICNDNLETKNSYENIDMNDDLETQNSEHENKKINEDNQHKSENMQQNFNNGNAITNNDSEISNDNLETKNNYENIDINDDLETQNSKHENKSPDYDSKMLNDNLDLDNPTLNNSITQNENNDVQQSSETDIENDNFNINHTDNKNNDGDDMNNHLENQNESLNAIDLNSKTNTHSDCINSNIDTENNENTQLHRIGDETKNWDVSRNLLEEPNLVAQNSMEKELQNSAVNGIHENDTTNDNCGESIIETKKITNESPIKHSIENLIGDTDKNPDKYIDEVISSIEDIINKNPRNEDTDDHFTNGENSNQMDDRMLMDALDTQIGEEKEKTDSEKITLDDLLPKTNTPMELDDISDDDFNFDA